MTWDVWHDLEARSHIELAYALLAGGAEALIEDLGGGWRRITLEARLDRRARRAALAHELVHDERGLLFDANTPAGLVQTEERSVQAEVIRRLVPPDALGVLLARCAEGHRSVECADVANEFDVPASIALAALRSHARLMHPSSAPFQSGYGARTRPERRTP
jgi:hypothetical protein